MPRSESVRKAQSKYDKTDKRKNSYVVVSMKLFKSTDSNIINWLNNLTESKSAYLRRLIREDMKKSSARFANSQFCVGTYSEGDEPNKTKEEINGRE